MLMSIVFMFPFLAFSRSFFLGFPVTLLYPYLVQFLDLIESFVHFLDLIVFSKFDYHYISFFVQIVFLRKYALQFFLSANHA